MTLAEIERQLKSWRVPKDYIRKHMEIMKRIREAKRKEQHERRRYPWRFK